jgi:hypothetical protein
VLQVVLEQAVPQHVPRDERQYAAQLRKHVIATSDPDITEAQIKEKMEGINHAAEIYEIGPAEQACLYKYVWDKGLLGVGQATYGELLNEFFDDCDVGDKFGHQKKLKVFHLLPANQVVAHGWVEQVEQCCESPR